MYLQETWKASEPAASTSVHFNKLITSGTFHKAGGVAKSI
ncbi:Unannotated [Lentimonas sp. CC19]|nr:Unannotated [Lentimonas sp. CC10]CAA6691056.1 Unannotated [Lentimonas sp. CC19]CAA7069330.1 Unannotated [Lentimonas sp. CC11]